MLHDYNLDARADEFINYVHKAANAYRTNNVAITTGMDFHYQVMIYFGLSFCFMISAHYFDIFVACWAAQQVVHFILILSQLINSYQFYFITISSIFF